MKKLIIFNRLVGRLRSLTSMGGVKDYLVRLDSANVELPHLCAICKQNAERTALINANARSYLRIRTKPLWLHHRGRTMSVETDTIRRSLRVPVCDEHYISNQSKQRLRPTCILINGVSLVSTIFAGLLIVAASLDQFMIGFQWFLFLELSLIIAVTSLVWLRPSDLERIISIYRIEPGTKETVLKLKHKWYLDELLRLNPNTARRVVVKKGQE